MPFYYMNLHPQPNGDHEVHELGNCPSRGALIPLGQRLDLGQHATCYSAVQRAKALGYPRADGCFYCSRPCHTR